VNNLEMVNENMMCIIYFHFWGNLVPRMILKILKNILNIATSLKINLQSLSIVSR